MIKFSTARQEEKLLSNPAAQMFVLTDAELPTVYINRRINFIKKSEHNPKTIQPTREI